MGTAWYMAVTICTFDAAIMLAVVLGSDLERYHVTFEMPYKALTSRLQRLRTIGPCLPLASSGADVLQITMRCVVEAQERTGFVVDIASLDAKCGNSMISPNHQNYNSTTGLPPVAAHPLTAIHGASRRIKQQWIGLLLILILAYFNPDVLIPLKELLWDQQGWINV